MEEDVVDGKMVVKITAVCKNEPITKKKSGIVR